MITLAVDTLKVAQALHATGMPRKQAEGVAGAIADAVVERPSRGAVIDAIQESAIGINGRLDATERRLTERIDAVESRLTERIDAVESRLGGRIDAVEGRLGAVEGRLGAVEGRIGAVEDRLGAVEGRLGAVEARLGAVETQIVELKAEHGAKLAALEEGQARVEAKVDRIEVLLTKLLEGQAILHQNDMELKRRLDERG